MTRARLPLPPLPDAGARWSLFLDLDGTLAPLAPHPDQVRLSPDLLTLLQRLAARLEGAVCVLSGRPRAQLERLLDGAGCVQLVGSHGAEPAGGGPAPRPPAIDRLRAAVAAELPVRPGLWIEDKPFGFAVHFRGCPGLAGDVRRIVCRHLATAPGLRGLAGDGVAEVMAAGADKGRALAEVAASPAFRGRSPVAVGDDVTDEAAFDAAAALAGFGVRVGAREPTVARYALPCVPLAHTWLAALAERLPVGERAPPAVDLAARDGFAPSNAVTTRHTDTGT